MSDPVPRVKGRFEFSLASDADDAGVRRLLREHPIRGAVRLSFEREPDASLAASIEGDVHQTLVARVRSTGDIAGVAARSERRVFVNGQAVRLGYLGQLRVGRIGTALRALLDGGFDFLRTLHEDGEAPTYLMSLIEDNVAARRLLVERRWAGAPRFFPAGRLETYVVSSRSMPRRETCDGIRLLQGTPGLLGEIADCLQRNLRRFQFAPQWTEADLRSKPRTRGLSAEDFVVAVAGATVVGCAALWDQRAFKQVVVRGYRPALRRTRPLVNLAARVLGSPVLPATGEPLRFAYLSHIAVDDDREDVLRLLIAALVGRARLAGLDYVVAGFGDGHPFQSAMRRTWSRRTFASVLYLACWPDGEPFVRSLDDRPAQPEIATL